MSPRPLIPGDSAVAPYASQVLEPKPSEDITHLEDLCAAHRGESPQDRGCPAGGHGKDLEQLGQFHGAYGIAMGCGLPNP